MRDLGDPEEVRDIAFEVIDNLKKHQTFVVQSGVGSNYVYGYKLVNGVHGKVKASSLDKNC